MPRYYEKKNNWTLIFPTEMQVACKIAYINIDIWDSILQTRLTAPDEMEMWIRKACRKGWNWSCCLFEMMFAAFVLVLVYFLMKCIIQIQWIKMEYFLKTAFLLHIPVATEKDGTYPSQIKLWCYFEENFQ